MRLLARSESVFESSTSFCKNVSGDHISSGLLGSEFKTTKCGTLRLPFADELYANRGSVHDCRKVT